MKENSVFKHFAIVGLGSFISLFLGVITTPIITRLVDPAEYGKYSIYVMYSNMALMFMLLGMDQAVIRFYYDYDSIEYRRALNYRCIKLPVMITIITSIIVIGTSILDVFKYEFETTVVSFLCLYTLVQVIYRFSHNLMRLEYNTKMYSGLNVVQKVSYVLIVVPSLLFLHCDSLIVLVYSTFFALLICLMLSFWYQKLMWNISVIQINDCKISYLELLNYSLPLIVSMGITTLFQSIDKISLNYYCSYQEVGVYSAALTMVNIFAVIQSSFTTLWGPMAIKHYSQDPGDTSFFQQGNRVITVVMFFIGINLILFKDLFALLLGPKYRYAAYVLPFLIYHPIMYTISETTVIGITFSKKTGKQIIVASLACLTNIVGNLLLVPIWGCRGAAVSTGLSYIVFWFVRTYISNKYFYVDFGNKKFAILTVFTSLYALYSTFIDFNKWSIIGYFICISVLFYLYKKTFIFCFNYLRELYKRRVIS